METKENLSLVNPISAAAVLVAVGRFLDSSSSTMSLSLASTMVDIAGVRLHKRLSDIVFEEKNTIEKEVVITSTSLVNLRRLAFAISLSHTLGRSGRPILLEGPSGSGKTTLLRFIARSLGFLKDMVELHLDDSTDGKSLLGTYVCTDVPGEFKWQPGAVTSAAVSGRWLLIEDIDRAPFDVLASLGSLLESRTLVLPGRAKIIHAHPNFQLFATRSCAYVHNQHYLLQSVNGALSAFVDRWLRVPFILLGSSIDNVNRAALEKLSLSTSREKEDEEIKESGKTFSGSGSNELLFLLTSLFPSLPPFGVLDHIMACHDQLERAFNCSSSALSKHDVKLCYFPLSLERFGRNFSARDVIRWALRVEKLTSLSRRQIMSPELRSGGAASMPTNHPVFLTESEKLAIVNEGISVISSHIPSSDIRRSVARALGSLWGLSIDAVDESIDSRKPSVSYSFGASSSMHLTVGDIVLLIEPKSPPHASFSLGRTPQPLPIGFAPTRHSMNLLERLAACVCLDEPALLVGETGNGKTSVIQALAYASGKQLLVYNLNVQSDSADLVGGFKPVHLRQIAVPLLQKFENLFLSTFQESAPNQSFIEIIKKAVYSDDWAKTIGGFMRALQRAHEQTQMTAQLKSEWVTFNSGVKNFERQYRSSIKLAEKNDADSSIETKRATFAFSFVDGVLVQALRQGHWLLLDEINLASAETLQRLAGLLEGGSVTLTEKGEADPVPRHPNFRLFAAMNPATDFGKRNLPPALRARFSEIYVPDVEAEDDLSTIVSQYISNWPSSPSQSASSNNGNSTSLIGKIVSFYLQVRRLSAPVTGCLRDGASSRPHYSLRSLTRSLQAATILIEAGFEAQRACKEGMCAFFVTQLEESSAKVVLDTMRQYFGGNTSSVATLSTTSTTVTTGKKKDNKQSQLALDLIARLGGSGGGGGSNISPQFDDNDSEFSMTNIPRPRGLTGKDEDYIFSNGFWLHRGPNIPINLAEPDKASGAIHYVLVPSVKRHLRSLSRAVACQRFPVLLQGPTSAGKTSMIEYLAKATGHECVRINNHEHTDIAEYIGSYASTSQGRLEFSEGLLVKALRRGNWLILDELNLAPSEVLEALNRLLDDNRELFIPETQETVRPHPNFILFATQNPAGAAYGGRKPLSLAFRNRFIELHIDDIPSAELHTIIIMRSRLPSTFVEKMVSVMQELQRLRQGSDVFAGRHGFITPRDLLRWAQRQPRTFQSLAEEGFALLGERLRISSERDTVKFVLESVCKVVINLQDLYDAPFSITNTENSTSLVGSKRSSSRVDGDAPKRARLSVSVKSTDDDSTSAAEAKEVMQNRLQSFLSFRREMRRTGLEPVGVNSNLKPGSVPGTEGLSSLTVTRSLRRLFDLVGRCIANDEPVLLVGDTGCGKTTVIQLFALLLQHPLHVINCHVHTETADILGSLRPVRSHASSALFEWSDGPLVQAMQNGDFFLLDEASLAEDAVLERLNSVLEPSRSLTLAEKADTGSGAEGGDSRSIKAASSFRIFATMNPGGDFGKRELSPALRNRFTEIWVPALSSDDDKDGEDTDLRLIIAEKAADVFSSSLFRTTPSNLNPLTQFVDPIVRFVKWFEQNASHGLLATLDEKKNTNSTTERGSRVFQLTLRDLHSWLAFMGATLLLPTSTVSPWEAYAHGACLVLLDGLGLGMGLSQEACERIRNGAAKEISQHAPLLERSVVDAVLWPNRIAPIQNETPLRNNMFGVMPFFIPTGSHSPPSKVSFALEAPTTRSNLVRVLRALQLRRPVLLEGSPGVGKTSLIEAIARQSGHKLVRINLSDQTDVSDLFGQDLPSSNIANDSIGGGSGSKFAWCDGVFLQALRNGDWVLLDELNLAPQAVLESLNAVLDHRGTVYIPELNQTFPCAPGFQVFATQNPVAQGGGRKGLPKSFLNRFAKVYVESLTTYDQLFIARSIFPQLDVPIKYPLGGTCGESPDSTTLVLMTKYCEALHTDTMGHPCLYGQEGRPWEFNLRDLFRWCDLIISTQTGPNWDPGAAVEHVLWTRLRSLSDRAAAAARFISIFGSSIGDAESSPQSSRRIASLITLHSTPSLRLTDRFFAINDVVVPRAALPGSWEPSSIDSNVSLKVGTQLALKLLESTSRSDISIARDYEDRKNKGSSIVGPLSPSLLYSMYHCAQAVVSSSPVLLVGRRSTGKSATLVHLAQLCGARLRIVPLTPSTDATELVGCFEQADPKRRLDEVLDAATGLVHGFLAALSALELHGDITSMTHERIISVSTSLREHTASQISLSNVELILSILEASKDIIYNESFTGRIASVRTQALAVQSAVDNISAERGSFEWVDGTLVEAMERGEWVVVENVNFCAASVVDRLNPMLEPGGSLLISECGLDASGMPRIIRASPSFRIFFTLDPSLGDVSRALRNRCVEIALTSPDENLGTGKGNVSAAAKLAVDKVFSTTSSSTPVYRAAQIISSRITASNSRVDNTRVFALSSADENDGPLLATVAKGAVEAHESAIQSAVLSSTAPPRFRQLVYLGDALRALSQIHSKSTSKLLFLEDALIAFDLIYRNYSSTETARNALASSLFNMQTLPSIGLPSLLELAPVSTVQKNTSDLEPLLPLLLAVANPQDSHSIGALFFIAGAGEGEIHEIAHSRWIVDIAREFLSRVPLTSVTAVRDRLHAFNKFLISSQIPDILRVPGLSFSSAFAAQIETFKIVDGDVPQILSLLPVDFNSAPHLWKYLDVIVRQSGTGVNLMDIKRFCSRLLLCAEESGDVAMRTSEIESSISLQSTSVTAIALAITLAQRLGLPLPSSFSLLTTSSQFTARSLERYLGGQSLALVASVCESIRAASFMALQSPAIADRDISFLVKVRDACRRIHQLLLRTKVSIAAESLSVPLEHPNLAPTIFILWRRVVKSLRRSWYVLLGVLSQGQQNSLLSSTYQCTLALNNSSDASESSIESLNHNIKPEDLLERALHKPLDFLWRFGGHPGISRSSETFKSSQSIFNLLTELKETIAVPPVRTEDRLAEGYEGRGLRSLDIVGGSTCADILGLVGTIHIVSSDLSAPLQTIKASLSASEDILVSVRQIVTARTPPLPEIGEGLEDGDMDTDEGDGSGGRTSLGVDAPLLTRLHLSALSGVLMRRAVLLQPALAEATELHCLVEERMLIASLHNLMIRESGFTLPDNDFLLPIESLISRVNRVIAISLAATRWNPSDLLPLRVVSWILNDPNGCMLQRLRDIVPSLSASWHSRAEDAKLYDHDAARLYQNSYADSSQICSRSVDALVRRSCALYAFESRTYSLQLLASHCSTNIEVSQNVAKASRTVAISQFLILLLSAEWIFTQSSKEMQQEYRQDVKAWWEEVVVFGRVDHFNPFRILESLKKGQDSRIRTLLPPTSNLFAVTLEAAGRAFEQNINTQDLSIRAFTFSTRVAQLRYLLLLPSSPVDPALKPALKRAELEKNCTEKRGELALRQLTRALTLGESYISLVDLQSLSQSSDEKISSYAVELQSAEPLRTKYISREVFRPSEQSLNCSFSVVYAESRGFARNMLSSERIDGALMRLTNLQSNDNSATEAQAWASAAQSFAQRLRSFFSVFKDIADPLMVAISDMACAKRSLALIKSQSFAKSPLHHMEIVPSSTQTTVSTGMAAVSLLQVRTMQVEKKARDALSGLISVHYSSHDKNELVINSQKSNTSFLIGETTEEREAREFREVIPDHFKTHFGEFARSPQEMLTDYKAPEAKSDMFDAVSSDSISTKTMKATPRALAEEYIKLFGGSSNGLPRLPSDDGLSYDRLWSMSMSSPLAPISSKSMPRLLYELSVMSSRYSIITQDVHAEPNENFGYNYYRDTNLSESTLAIRPARDFAGRCYELLQTFPSNEVLAMLLRVTDQFLRLPASAPVALLLSGAQLIVTKAQEWEVNAPALYQIGPQLITMSQLVTRWRKLELSSWSKLLLSANGEQRESAAQLFFLLRSAFLETPNEVIDFIRNNLPENGQSCSKKFQKLLPALGSVFSEGNVGIPHHAAWAVQVRTRNATRLGVNSSSATSLLDVTSVLDTHLRSCFEAADRFVRASPKGQFRVRLQLLGSLSEELISHNLSDPLLQQIRLRLSIIARNVRSFYSQYIDAVQISIDESSRPVLKTVHDQATIHRWDEQSYYALRESAEKSHKIVFHALRDYRLVLAESIGPVIEEFSAGKVSEAGPSPAINKAIKSRKKKPLSAISSTLSDSLLDIRNAAVVKLKSVLLQESTEKEGKAIPLEIIQSSSLSLPAIRRRMLQLLTRGARGLCSKDAIRVRDLNIESIENFSLSIFHVIDELSELTEPLPSSLNKDSVKKSAPGGSSRMMKQRALTNTLRGMSRLGLSPLSSSVSPKQSEFIELMQVPSLYQTSFVNSGSGSASACLQSADEYYFRSLDEVLRLRLRLASGDWHKDLAQSDVRKGVGFMEHLISLMLQQRGMIRASYVQVSGLSLFLKQLEESSSIDKSVISTSFLSAKASLTTSEEAESALSDAVTLLSGGKTLLKSLARTSAAAVSSSSTDTLTMFTNDVVSDEAVLSGLLFSHQQRLSDLGPALTSRMSALSSQFDSIESCLKIVQAARHSLEASLPRHGDISAATLTLHCDGRVQSSSDVPSFFEKLTISKDSVQKVCEAVDAAQTQVKSILEIENGAAGCQILLLKAFSIDVLTRLRIRLSSVSESLTSLNLPNATCSLVESISKDIRSSSCELIKEAMLAVQSLSMTSGSSDSTRSIWGLDLSKSTTLVDESDTNEVLNDDEEETSVNLAAITLQMFDTLDAAQLPVLALATAQVVHSIEKSFKEDTDSISHAAALARGVLEAHRCVELDAIRMHKATCKLALVVGASLLRLMKDGFCSPPDSEEGEAGEDAGEGGNKGEGKFHAGTGIGEGKGQKDVSDQIENEEQVLGLKGDDEKQASSGPQDKSEEKDDKERKNGLEMQSDFAGDLFDISEEENDEGDKDEKKDDDEEEDADREMGKADGNNSRIVDEKLWNGSDDENNNSASDDDSPEQAKSSVKEERIAA
jgi:midasin (ATPase involved in ribosome maturation)